MRAGVVVLTLAAAMVAACGGDAAPARAASEGLAPPPPATAIALTIDRGPDSGRYEAASEEALCTEGLVGPRTWGVQYSRLPARERLGSVQLIVTDTAALRLDVAFGGLLDGRGYSIETRSGTRHASGRATATARDSGPVRLLEVRGSTADGVGIAAVVRCRRVRQVWAGHPGLHY
jgi:hypothetical protein